MQIEKLLARVQSLKIQFALQSLDQPKDKSTYEFGRIVGTLDGLNRIEQLVAELVEEEKHDRDE